MDEANRAVIAERNFRRTLQLGICFTIGMRIAVELTAAQHAPWAPLAMAFATAAILGAYLVLELIDRLSAHQRGKE